MQSAETVLSILRDRGRRGLPCNEMFRQLFNPQMYLNRSGFDRDSFPWKDRVRYGEAISEGAQGAGR
ncbi:hypothetical protein ACIA74_42805, partial [Streptomyces sp. NPDC051658]